MQVFNKPNYLVLWQSTIDETRRLLDANPEWIQRYCGYADEIENNRSVIEAARKSFHEWAPLKLYLNVSDAKKSRNFVYLNLRNLGQSVASLKKTNDSLLIDTSDFDETNLIFGCPVKLRNESWTGGEASKFRSYFRKINVSQNVGNEEHRLESLILSDMSKTKDKMFVRMRPVKIGGLRFPMPTPLSASNHKTIRYSGKDGGGIDILARMGIGGNTKLCIIELKDQNNINEPPAVVIQQALVYTTFIRELLRSPSGNAWYKLFGFSGDVPSKLTLHAACAMPTGANDDQSFGGIVLPLGGNDEVILQYFYFTETNNQITNVITSV